VLGGVLGGGSGDGSGAAGGNSAAGNGAGALGGLLGALGGGQDQQGAGGGSVAQPSPGPAGAEIDATDLAPVRAPVPAPAPDIRKALAGTPDAAPSGAGDTASPADVLRGKLPATGGGLDPFQILKGLTK